MKILFFKYKNLFSLCVQNFEKNVDSVHKMLYITLISKQRCTLKTNTPVVGPNFLPVVVEFTFLTGEVVGEENEKGRCDIFFRNKSERILSLEAILYMEISNFKVHEEQPF